MRPLPITYEETEHLYQKATGDGLRSILFVSAENDTGTSTVAYGVAQRIAAAGKKVLYVDFDANSSFPVLSLAIEPTPWTVESVHRSFAPFDVPGSGLSISAAPPGGFVAVEQRDSSLIKEAMVTWLEKYDYVVGDAPCLCQPSRNGLPTNLLASAFNAVVLVLLSGGTSANSAQSAVRRLQESRAQILGVVMNDRDMPPLKDELTRQAKKLRRVTPQFSEALRGLVQRMPILEVSF